MNFSKKMFLGEGVLSFRDLRRKTRRIHHILEILEISEILTVKRRPGAGGGSVLLFPALLPAETKGLGYREGSGGGCTAGEEGLCTTRWRSKLVRRLSIRDLTPGSQDPTSTPDPNV